MAVLKFPAKTSTAAPLPEEQSMLMLPAAAATTPALPAPQQQEVAPQQGEMVPAPAAPTPEGLEQPPLETPTSEPERSDNPASVSSPATSISHHPLYFIYEAFLLFSRAAAFTVAAGLRYVVRYPLHALFNVALLVLLGLTVFTGSEINKQLILGQISDNTVNQILMASRFTREFDAEDVDRSAGRELLRVGAPVWAQRESVQAVLYHARKVGLPLEDQAVLLAVVDIESGFNPFARAGTTSACGLFQFVKRTGELFGLAQSHCMDPWKNAEAGVAHYLYNYGRRVQPKVTELQGAERLFKTFELSYYLHHDGPESNNPNNDVKATILEGTQFLFKVYRVLLEEQGSQTRVPSFAEKFSQNFWRMVETLKGLSWWSRESQGSPLELGANPPTTTAS